MPEEGQGAIPRATPGWHIPLHAPLCRSGVWGGNTGVQYFGETHLGSTLGWDVPLGRTIPPGWVPQMGSPSTEGSDRILPTPPAPPQHHPVVFHLFQATISILIIIIFPPRLPSQHQPRFSVYRRDSANTKGGNVSLLHHLFFPKCHVGVQDCTPRHSSSAMATELSQLLLQTFPSRGPFAMDTSDT